MDNFFGTDGIRGEVGKKYITVEFFLKLGWAVGTVLAQKYDNPNVIIGKDTRISGYMFESALESGFLSSGVSVGLLGPMPTPAIAYLTKTYGASGGVVISASHNVFTDNGVKFFSNNGLKLSSDEQQQISQKLQEKIMVVDGHNIGKARRYEQAVGRYIEFCKSTFDRQLTLKGLKLVIDTANGATYHIAGSIFRELGAEVILINNTPNGININENCGATDVRELAKKVINNKADIGIAFDGDGDRVIMIDNKGHKVDGDELLLIIAKYYKEQNQLINNAVVGTQMTNFGIRSSLQDSGINFIETKVGDRFVMEQMQNNNLILGGESSGHIICSNHSTSGDGIIASLQVLEAIITSKKTLYDLKQVKNKYYQALDYIKINQEKNIKLDNDKLKQIKIKIEKKLANNGRILIRKSGTESLIRVMVESKDANFATNSVKELISNYK